MISKMNPEIKNRWTKALRSGKYKQGKGLLRDSEDRYCCLGVLCDVVKSDLGLEWESFMGCYSIENYEASLPDTIVKFTGVNSTGYYGKVRLVLMNDRDGYTFNEIAEVIEKEL